MQAVGEEGEEDVGFDPLLVLVEDRADGEVALEVFEGLFDCTQTRQHHRSALGGQTIHHLHRRRTG